MDLSTYRVMLHLNPWIEDQSVWPGHAARHLPENYIPRSFSPELSRDKVSLIIGPRQAGKSTLAWKTISSSLSPFVFINCEEQLLKELCSSPALFLDELDRLAPDAAGYFFEEAQHLEEAGLFLKGLVDLKPEKKILATGSSSYHLKSKTRESLAGRAIRHVLHPFGLRELVPGNKSETVARIKAREIWHELALYGGYPEAWLSRNRQDVLGRLTEAFVLRDASDLYQIKNPSSFRKLMELAASQTANLTNYSSFADNLGISVNTVAQYLSILEQSHIIRLLPPFVGGKRAEITSRPKIFFLDNGIRNYLFGGFDDLGNRADRGALTENLVFSELCKRLNLLKDQLYYWRSTSGAEVDFVLKHDNRLVAVEVKSGAMKKPRISRSLRSFIQAYGPDMVYVVNNELDYSMDVQGTEIRFIPGWDLFIGLNWQGLGAWRQGR
ncbi:ATP-binding protein [Desulfonatronovibrio hydrogenovorans]|uniref:ATP-binding protein n=1 Tax=Desulfonatronovibrio hydrogenovorans TaxID=53245 RepID=UPI001378BF70|nr:ATP-binding protein [Desulfonatronovibrio hydrogenovorans]